MAWIPKKDLTGKKFGRLTALNPIFINGRWFLRCICLCGKFKNIQRFSLINGDSKSCGCLLRKGNNTNHGMCYTSEYSTWRTMRDRCLNKNVINYSRYGGRGVKICERYKNSFQNFFNDLGLKPTPDHTVDRVKNHLHYSCGKCEECKTNGWKMNVRWATDEIQRRNKRNNKWHELEGKRMIQADWAIEFGVSHETLHAYLKSNSIKDAALFYSKSKRKYVIK